MESDLVTLDDIRAARTVIMDKLHRTPMLSASGLGAMFGAELFLKAELFQKTGSFKPRGSLNKLNSLSDEEKSRGVISLSAGNHAAGLSYAAAQSGIKSTVVMPQSAPQSKIDATRGYGGEVILAEKMTDLMPTMQALQQERGAIFVHPFDDLLMIAGHATAGLEILEDVPEPDIVVVPIGGGGLISGISTALKLSNPRVRVIGVEPVGAAGMTKSLAEGAAAHLDELDTIADGLAAPFVGEHNFAHVKAHVDEVLLVTDDEIRAAMRHIMERNKIVPEPAGAASFAALLHRKFDFAPGARIVCVVSGGNFNSKMFFGE
jgi:threonine dehydratase